MVDWQPRSITESEIDEFRSRISQGFGHDLSEEEGARERFGKVFELERTVAVFDDQRIVGTGAAFTFDLTVPGGTVPMGGTTVVTVRPTHRRRGILSAMIDFHLDEVAARGEPVAGLWASEGSIYRRFGYGIASSKINASIDASKVVITAVESDPSVQLVEVEDAETQLRAVYEAVRTKVSGMFTRSEDWWGSRVFGPDNPSGGWSKLRYGLAIDSGSPVGYVVYRQKLDWTDGPDGEVQIIEMMTSAPNGRRALWKFLTNIDLFGTVKWWNMPVDEPLQAMVTDPPQITGKSGDALWIRLLDIEAALSARRYQVDGTVNIGVTDPFRPGNDGTYRLAVSEGAGQCVRTDDDPDVTCGVDVLGHLYLGGGNAMSMAAGARLVGSDMDVRTLHRMFHTDEAPWCPEVF